MEAETKSGYKMTEAGLIPCDWELEILENLSSRIGDGIHSTPSYNDDGEYYFVNGNNLVDGKIAITEETKKVTKDEFLKHQRSLNNTTILLSINGTIGNIAFYRDENIVLGKSAAYINLNNRIDRVLFYHLIQSNFTKKYFENELTGSTIKNLGLGAVRNTPIPLPPLPEQTAIANALKDTDNLINSLENLIAKKKLIKQGAMQELLKPMEGWVKKKLGEVVDFYNGKAHENSISINGDFIVVNSKFISTNGVIFKNSNVCLFPLLENDIVMVMSDIPNGKALAKCLLITKNNKYTLNQRICVLRSKEADTKFLYYILNRHEYFLGFDSGSGQTNLRKIEVLNCPISLPFDIVEQKLISTRLTDIDSEISELEEKLGKVLNIKQGMMQQLLTGKIRLPH